MSKPRILFVDDEPQILDGLRTLLRKQRSIWDMVFAVSGAAGLEALSAARFDVVVSDMRMPTMNGEQFLLEVKKRQPHVARFVLTGETEPTLAIRSVSVVHQVLAKPCDPVALQSIVERACALTSLVADDQVRAALGGVSQLPSLPAVCRELDAALAEDACTDRLARIIERDIALSTKLLQIINSAFFGLPRQVHGVRRAVVTLGTGILRALAMSVHLVSEFRAAESAGLSLVDLQARAIVVGRLAQRLCHGELAERAFTAGLLHDVGKLILATHLGEQWRVATTEARLTGADPLEIERRVFGVCHAEVGGYLLGLWGLPVSIVEAVAHHHAPQRVAREGFRVVDAVHLADLLAGAAVGGALGHDAVADAGARHLAAIGASEHEADWTGLVQAHREGRA